MSDDRLCRNLRNEKNGFLKAFSLIMKTGWMACVAVTVLGVGGAGTGKSFVKLITKNIHTRKYTKKENIQSF